MKRKVALGHHSMQAAGRWPRRPDVKVKKALAGLLWRCVLASLAMPLLACDSGTSDVLPPDSGPVVSTTETSSPGAGAPAPDAGPDGPVQPLAGYPAEHSAFPQVLSTGGPVLSAPNVVPIFFSNDADQAQVEQFLTELAVSPYWTATTSEYGVGALRLAASIVVPDAPPASITDAQTVTWLAGHLDGADPAWPAIDANNVYVVFYPQSTAVTGPRGLAGCTDMGGYHGEGFLSANSDDGGADAAGAGDADDAADAIDASSADDGAGASVARAASFTYAVLPRCAAFNTLTGIDTVTSALSHELIEAATDPRIVTQPGYALVDVDHFAWNLDLAGTVGGSEVGDMCQTTESPRLIYQPLVGSFIVQRTWSNRSAETGNEDPCVPSIPGAYFNAAPDVDELVVLYTSAVAEQQNQNPILSTGLSVPVGQSKTIAVRLFSAAPTPNLSVAAFGQKSVPLQIKFASAPSIKNGDILQVTITRTANGPTGGNVIWLVASTMAITVLADATTIYNSWPVFIAN